MKANPKLPALKPKTLCARDSSIYYQLLLASTMINVLNESYLRLKFCAVFPQVNMQTMTIACGVSLSLRVKKCYLTEWICTRYRVGRAVLGDGTTSAVGN